MRFPIQSAGVNRWAFATPTYTDAGGGSIYASVPNPMAEFRCQVNLIITEGVDRGYALEYCRCVHSQEIHPSICALIALRAIFV